MKAFLLLGLLTLSCGAVADNLFITAHGGRLLVVNQKSWVFMECAQKEYLVVVPLPHPEQHTLNKTEPFALRCGTEVPNVHFAFSAQKNTVHIHHDDEITPSCARGYDVQIINPSCTGRGGDKLLCVFRPHASNFACSEITGAERRLGYTPETIHQLRALEDELGVYWW